MPHAISRNETSGWTSCTRGSLAQGSTSTILFRSANACFEKPVPVSDRQVATASAYAVQSSPGRPRRAERRTDKMPSSPVAVLPPHRTLATFRARGRSGCPPRRPAPPPDHPEGYQRPLWRRRAGTDPPRARRRPTRVSRHQSRRRSRYALLPCGVQPTFSDRRPGDACLGIARRGKRRAPRRCRTHIPRCRRKRRRPQARQILRVCQTTKPDPETPPKLTPPIRSVAGLRRAEEPGSLLLP